MSKGIQVIERKIEVREFIDLRKAVGWGIPDTASIEKGLDNSLYCVCAQIEDEVVGMARVVGDGSICFYIQDVNRLSHIREQCMAVKVRVLENVLCRLCLVWK
jgi:hypothetical protein